MGVVTGIIKILLSPFYVVSWFFSFLKKPLGFIRSVIDNEKKYTKVKINFFKSKRKQMSLNDELQ